MRILSSSVGYAAMVLAILMVIGCASLQVNSQHPKPYQEIGLASYYAHKFHGRPTASGEIYDENGLTAAHPKLPFGTVVRVTNLTNKKSVILKVTDRGPLSGERIIDVSYRAAQELDFVKKGLVKVGLVVLERD